VLADRRRSAPERLDARRPKPQNYRAAAAFAAVGIVGAWLAN